MNAPAEQSYPTSVEKVAGAHVIAEKYAAMHQASINGLEGFWREQGVRDSWIKPFTQVKDVHYTLGNVSINWYADGQLNVSANCVDRHLATCGDQTAIIWEPDSPEDDALHITYNELHANTCKMANILRDLGVGKGDRVIIYLPMIPESAVGGYPHNIEGQGIYCYVTLMGGEEPSDELRKELETWVRSEIDPIAKPGKIMRRILLKIAKDDFGALGDTSTLADPSVVDDLIENWMNRT